MKILILDNYDSFTYNLVHYVKEISDAEVIVARNDQIQIEEIEQFSHILLSPGPGLPIDAGIMPKLIKKYAPSKSIFGVCLGMQAIGEAFGGELLNLDKVFHGLAMPVEILKKDERVFSGLPRKFLVGRYHSWIVNSQNIPEELEITAADESGLIMALRHKNLNVRGVQFHPESVLTEFGKEMIENWLSI